MSSSADSAFVGSAGAAPHRARSISLRRHVVRPKAEKLAIVQFDRSDLGRLVEAHRAHSTRREA
jgi:hypothetical protein